MTTKKIRLPRLTHRTDARGQSFVELMLVTLILALMIAGVVEFGFLVNNYLHVFDAAREAARFSSSGLAFYPNGTSINEFYTNTIIQAERVLDPVVLDPANGDDIVISVFSIAGSSIVRFPDPDGWSAYGNHGSGFTTTEIGDILDPTAPASGILLVEIFYNYPQMLKLPIFTNSIYSIVPDPIPVYVYSVMPLSSAEPTPTPRP
jgi:hypothetical protein